MSIKVGNKPLKVTLYIDKPDGKEIHTVTEFPFSIGRSSEAKIQIKQQNISRIHLIGNLVNGDLVFTDQDSSNGTFVNGERLAPFHPVAVRPADQLTIGKTEVAITFSVSTDEERPVREKMAQAEKESSAILSRAKLEAEQLLTNAREEAEDLRRQGQKGAEQLVAQAEREAEQARSASMKEGREILAEAKAQAEALRKKMLNEAVKEREEKIRADLADLLKEREDFDKEIDVMETQHAALIKAIEKHKKEAARLEHEVSESEEILAANKAKIAEFEEHQAGLKKQVDDLEFQRAELERKLAAEKQTLENAHADAESAIRALLADKEAKIERMKEEADENVQQVVAFEKARIDKVRAETMDVLIKNQESIANQIQQEVWRILQSAGMNPTDEHRAEAVSAIRGAIDSRLTQNFDGEESELFEVVRKKAVLKQWRYFANGAALAVLLLGGGWSYLTWLEHQSAEMAALEQAEELERQRQARRYEPEQDDRLRDNYTEAVLYTRGFAELYKNDETQAKWTKAASEYLFKRWRVDEEKSIRLIGLSTALVSELAEKKSNIHPDFVEENVQKMKEAEESALKEMTEILGTKVKLSAFKRFEKKFFSKELAERAPASQP